MQSFEYSSNPTRPSARGVPARLPQRQRILHALRTVRFALVCLPLLACATLVEAKDDPQVVMEVAPAAGSVFGTQLTFYAIITSPTPGGQAPTGTLTFARRDPDNSNHTICAVTIDTNVSLQSCDYPTGFYPAAGTNHFVVLYSGDANYNGNVADGFAFVDYVVTKQTPTIALDPPAPVFVGQYAALNLHIGNATLTDGFFGAEISGANGGCSIAAPGMTCFAGKTRFAGTYDVYAGFDGDANHNAVANALVGQISILPAPTTLTIAPLAPINLGNAAVIALQLTDVVDPAATFSGDVSVSDGEVSCPVLHLVAAPGNLSCTLTPVSAGVRHLTATYSGTSDIGASTATADLTVVGPKVDGVCGSDDGKTLTAPPTNLCSAGSASAVVGNGPWSWTCTGNNGGTTASCSAQLQTKTATTTTLLLSPNPASVGETVNANVTISGTSPTRSGSDAIATAPAATGGSATVSGGGATCTATVVNGIGNCSLSFVAPGTYTISASYSGDATNASSSGVATEIVAAAVPPGAVASAPTLDRWALWSLVLTIAGLAAGRFARRRR